MSTVRRAVRLVRVCWILAFFGLPGVAAGGPPVPRDTAALRFVLPRARVLYGPLEGFVQTPRGGDAATTSHDRPGFDELGIHDVVGGDIELGLSWRAWSAYAGVRLLRADSHSTLDAGLLSQGIAFPAGTRIRSQLRLDTYRLGLGRGFEIGLDDLLGCAVVVTPRVESILLDFDHRVDGEAPGQRTLRSYARFGTRVGAHIGLEREGFGLELFGAWGLPIGSLVEISAVEATASYAPPVSATVHVALQVGVLYEHTHFEDGQSTPNRIEADYGPALTAGLALVF
jgi:hypothetical protein